MRSNVDASKLSSACEPHTLLGNHHIHIFLSWRTRQFIALYILPADIYQLIILTSSSITQIIIINITIGITIYNTNNASPNSISNIKKSVINTHPTIQMRSDITTIVVKNDINTFIYYKYNKFTIYTIRPQYW